MRSRKNQRRCKCCVDTLTVCLRSDLALSLQAYVASFDHVWISAFRDYKLVTTEKGIMLCKQLKD